MSKMLFSDVQKDLEKRDAKLIGVIVETPDGLKVISYKNGVVDFVSETVDNINMNTSLAGCVVRPIARIGKKNDK